MKELTKKDIGNLLSELGANLKSKGLHVDFYMINGTAMLLTYNRYELTTDIHAIFKPKTEVYKAAKEIADNKKWLPSDWLNDAAKGFVQGPDPEAKIIFNAPGITLRVGSPKRILAMKVFSAHIDKGMEDIKSLVRLLKLKTVQEVLDIAYQEYGNILKAENKFLVQQELGSTMPLE